MPRKSRKSDRGDHDGDQRDHDGVSIGSTIRAWLLASAFGVMSLIVIYNAFALQPDAGKSQFAGNTINLHYDPMVEDIQRQLLEAGYFKGLVDGVSGEKTKAAIIAYQAASGLSADGTASQGLLDHIRLERKIADAATITASTDEATPQPARRDVAGRQVFLVQSALYDLGYEPGDLTGDMNEATRTAIRRFETDRHLSVTGDINAAVLAELAKTTGYESLAQP